MTLAAGFRGRGRRLLTAETTACSLKTFLKDLRDLAATLLKQIRKKEEGKIWKQSFNLEKRMLREKKMCLNFSVNCL